MTRAILPLLASLLLLSLLPGPAAAGSCVVTDPDLVCSGQPWCDDSGCGIPICATPNGPCVNNAPGSGFSNCLVSPTSTLGLVCTGERWCTNDGLCGQQICVTNNKVCVLNPPS